MRAVCHLLWYASGSGPLVSVVGNFDGPGAVSTTNAIEVIATRVAERVRRDTFRLFEWYPHDSERRFSEVTLTPVAERPSAQGRIVVGDDTSAQTVRSDSSLVRFADPHWVRRTENELASLLG